MKTEKKKKWRRNNGKEKNYVDKYGILGLYITFLEANSLLSGNNPPRGEGFLKHLLDVRNNGYRLNGVLESELVHLCHAQRTGRMSSNLPAQDRVNICPLRLEEQN